MNRQNGSALILSLLVLLVMTLLGISTMSTSSLEEKMAANDRNQKISFQNAELTLVDAENQVFDKKWQEDINSAIVGTNNGYFGPDDARPDYYALSTWRSGTTDKCIVMNNSQSDNKACYIVDHVSDQLPLEAGGGYGQSSQSNLGHKIVKVTSRSTDSNYAAAAMVQSTARIPFIPNP